jgi:hypothetical protein
MDDPRLPNIVCRLWFRMRTHVVAVKTDEARKAAVLAVLTADMKRKR